MSKNKIWIILALVIVLGIGFFALKSKPEEPVKNPSVNLKEFNQAIILKLNDTITFLDGLRVVLKEINDSRCPKDVQCIWAGEIGALLILSGGELSKGEEIRLGTVTKNSIIVQNYTFSLGNATENYITIIVENKK